MFKKITFLILIFSLISTVFAQNYYADLEITVADDGSTTISGITNYQELQNITNSQIYTSKKGEYWTFNLTTNQVFDNFIYRLNLPDNVDVNYIKTTPQFRIEDTGESLAIIGLGEKRPLNILVQYKVNKKYEILTHENIIAFLTGFSIILIVVLIIFFIKFNVNNKVSKNIEKKERNEDNLLDKVNLDILPDRQKEIVDIVREKEKITQKELVKIMQIPKSSVSRNVNSLVARNILDKEKIGITTYIFLKKSE